MNGCSYCEPKSEVVLWQDDRCRVILPNEPGFVGWCRVIWQNHIRELSDLDDADRNHLMNVVSTVERTLIGALKPTKMNIAALGTAGPHLHFHVIPRYEDDPTFPEPVWTNRQRESTRIAPRELESEIRTALKTALAAV